MKTGDKVWTTVRGAVVKVELLNKIDDCWGIAWPQTQWFGAPGLAIVKESTLHLTEEKAQESLKVIAADFREFCTCVLRAIDGETYETEWFSEEWGLCTNAAAYDDEYDTSVAHQLETLLGANRCPFNHNDFDAYQEESWAGTLYKNEERIAFLKKYALYLDVSFVVY